MLLNSCQCMANSSFLLFNFSGIIFPNISDPHNIGWILRYRNYGDKQPTLAGALWDKDKIWGCSQCSCLCFWFPSASICHRDYFLKAIDGDQWLWLLTPFLYPQKVWCGRNGARTGVHLDHPWNAELLASILTLPCRHDFCLVML